MIDVDRGEGRHSSTGGVRHVTYHVDDYLGKIYEEMYYRLPSTERIDTDTGSTSGTLDSRGERIVVESTVDTYLAMFM